MPATNQSTEFYVSFHSDEGFDGAIDARREDLKRRPFRIVGVNTNKMFGATANWSLTVKAGAGVSLHRLWRDPEDVWVRIVALRNNKPVEVMLGLIDTITEKLTRGPKGERSLVYVINGRDFGKVFDITQLYVNIHEQAGTLPMIPLYDAFAKKLIGSPDFVVRTVIEAWLGNHGVADKQWRMPKSLGGKFFFDVLKLDLQECRGAIYDPSLYSPDQQQGRTLWDTLTEYSNGMLNEMYVELTAPSTFNPKQLPDPTLILRERPFPTRDNQRVWDGLTTHRLAAGEVKGRDITKGAPESRFNYWLIDAQGLVGNGLAVQLLQQAVAARDKGVPGSAPIYSSEEMRKHGFRKFMQATRFFPFRDEPNWLLHSVRWLHLLHDWYVVGPYELTGSLSSSVLRPEVRIGHRLIEERQGEPDVTYYVEGVTHSWQYPGAGVTSFHVTRGEYADENLLDIVYERVVHEVDLLSAAQGAGDEVVGQADTPERDYLRAQGRLESNEALTSGEPQTFDEGRVTNLRPGDLPDRQIGLSAEQAVKNGPVSRGRTQGGSLTQYELESGVRLPVDEEHTVPDEPASDSTGQAVDRWRRRGGP